MPDSVLYRVQGAVATLTLNRPERLNAIAADMLDRLLAALERAASDEAVRVVVLTGAGRGFCPGADIASLAQPAPSAEPPPFEARVGSTRRWMRIPELLWGMPKITIAAVNGACAGAGLSWALSCDLRFAARSAVFRTAFIGVGVSGDYGVNWSLPRVVGWGKARELLLLNAKVSPEEALRIGMVARVIDDALLLPEVDLVASGLASAPQAGVLGIKQNLIDAESMSLAEELNHESRRLARSLGTEEARAAARSFRAGQ
ncbi:MAG TPA: enoyl-CoA hydratase-related protein [Acidimicrobiales bacterium]